jgi:hypothetical protein
MVKLDFAALIASSKIFAGSDPESIMISTELREKPVRLEVVIYKPPGDGPFPLLVVNHVSTGRGNNPALFTQTFSNPGPAARCSDRWRRVCGSSPQGEYSTC